jgi:hypothetical protein
MDLTMAGSHCMIFCCSLAMLAATIFLVLPHTLSLMTLLRYQKDLVIAILQRYKSTIILIRETGSIGVVGRIGMPSREDSFNTWTALCLAKKMDRIPRGFAWAL